jgi:hypothetical protein
MRRAYNLALRTPMAERFILPDLNEFCHANEPAPKGGDPFLQGRMAGRRDVWLHVSEWLHLTEEEQFALYQWRSINKGGM